MAFSLKKLLSKLRKRPARRQERRCQLSVEGLEERLVPSTAAPRFAVPPPAPDGVAMTVHTSSTGDHSVVEPLRAVHGYKWRPRPLNSPSAAGQAGAPVQSEADYYLNLEGIKGETRSQAVPKEEQLPHMVRLSEPTTAVAVAQTVKGSPQTILSMPAATHTNQAHQAPSAIHVHATVSAAAKAPAAAVSRIVVSGAAVLAAPKHATPAVRVPSSFHRTLDVHGVLTSPGVAGVVHIGAGDAADSTFDCFMAKIGYDTVTGLGGGIVAGIPGGPVGIVIAGASGGLAGFGYGLIDGVINCTKPDPSGKSPADPATPPSGPTPSGDLGTPNPTPSPSPGPNPTPAPNPTPSPSPGPNPTPAPNPTPNPTPSPSPQPPQPGPGDPPPGGDPNQSNNPPTTCDPNHPQNGYPNPDGNGTGGPKGVVSDTLASASALAAVHSLASLTRAW
jgi:hypothetical protein